MSDVYRILAVDDSEESLLQIELYLDGPDFELTTARSGRAAFDLLLVDEFDLILLDVAMPEMSGIEVCQRLKQEPRTAPIPVIFLTARMRDETDKLAGFEVGGVDYLSKPFHRDELVARIRVVLQMQRDLAELQTDKHDLTARLQNCQRDIERLREQVSEHLALREADAEAPRGFLLVDGDRRIAARGGALSGLFGSAPGDGPTAVADLPEPWHGELDALLRADRRDTRLTTVATGPDDGEASEFELRRIELDGATLIEVRDVSQVAELSEQVHSREPFRVAVAEPTTQYRIRGLIGESPSLAEITELVDKLRNVRSTVLICGETGTGKELVARALHYDGLFARRAFIPIHCGAISPELIESELFGYEKGAFTGAQTSKQGLFSAADGGTVFLDEIAETSPDLQVKLLRVLQLGEVRPVGATHTKHVDVRIIAATNQDLQALVADGRFREDLYYRLDVVKIWIPPLRNRVEDIPRLVDHFLERFARRHGPKFPTRGISHAAVEALQSYPWPGNVRELENVIDGALARGCGEVLQESDLPSRILTGEPQPAPGSRSATEAKGPHLLVSRGPDSSSLRAQRDRVDKLALIHALARFNGDKREAARYLGMSRSTFYRKLKQFGVG